MKEEIRAARPEDLAAVFSLEKACFSDPWSRALLEKSLTDQTLFLIACAEEKPAGYFLGALVLDELQIFRVAVDPAFRRKGIGRSLLTEAVKRSGAALAFLEVRASNAGAIALYRSCGYEEIGVRKNFYTAPREDAVMMKWEWKHENSGN